MQCETMSTCLSTANPWQFCHQIDVFLRRDTGRSPESLSCQAPCTQRIQAHPSCLVKEPANRYRRSNCGRANECSHVVQNTWNWHGCRAAAALQGTGSCSLQPAQRCGTVYLSFLPLRRSPGVWPSLVWPSLVPARRRRCWWAMAVLTPPLLNTTRTVHAD